MEIKKEIIEFEKELPKQDRDEFAASLAGKFKTWDEDRQTQIDVAKEIIEEVYLNQPKKKFEEKLAWKSDVKLNALYNIKRAKKSMLYREIWSNPRQMFDVRGTSKQTEELAKAQKASIVDSLEKMQIGKQMDEGIDNLLDIGEIIIKTDWEQKRKVVKRQKKGIGWVLQNLARTVTGSGYIEQQFKDIEIPYYENARVESISPFMFVFDHIRYKVRNKESWDSCIKIYKRFETLDNIKNNSLYKITPEMEAILKQGKEDNQTGEQLETYDLRDKKEYSGQYSILFAHGDFKINGKVYKNYIAEVLAGQFLIRFEENPMYINPFILCALEFDPKTKRGISPLKSVLQMCKKQEELTNSAFNLQKLAENPPCWVNEQMINEKITDKDGNIYYQPGKFMRYKDFGGTLPQQALFSSQGLGDVLALLDQKIADTSSVSNVALGNIEDKKRTATELSLADKGTTAQTSKELDIIYQDLIVPMVENIGDLQATFKDGIEYVYTQEKGKNVEYKITNEIRQAQYHYIYEDRNAMYERKQKFQELYQLGQGLLQIPQFAHRVNIEEFATTAVEMIGFDNPEKFILPDNATTQLTTQIKQIPPQMQEQASQMLLQQLGQMQQQFQAQQQQQAMFNRAQEQVAMQKMRDEARTGAQNAVLG